MSDFSYGVVIVLNVLMIVFFGWIMLGNGGGEDL